MDKKEQLIEMYTEAGNRLLEMIGTLEEGTSRRNKQRILKQVNEIIAGLSRDAARIAKEIVEEAYKEGSNIAIEDLIEQTQKTKEELETTLSPVIHVRAVQEILDEVFYRILETNDNMTADAKQRIEEITRRANQNSLIEGVSRRQATKDAIAELLQTQITGIIAKNGAVIPADKYMANVIHYHQRKAHVEGSINRMIENVQDLVYVNRVGITCEMCAKYQGRVYSISGNDERFPKLDVRPPYHGHCVHNATAWVEDYQEEEDIQKVIKDSNRPFTDNRTEQNIRKYEEIQREKSQKNETRKQWIRYKARMPDLPDLRTFASQKARDTELYQEWQWTYRQLNLQIKARDDISSGKYPLQINTNKQKRHIVGTNEYKDYVIKLEKDGYKPGILEKDSNDLMRRFAGKGRIIVSSANQPPKESVNTGDYVGKYYDINKDEMISTNWVMICYSKSGAHIYPKKGDEY